MSETPASGAAKTPATIVKPPLTINLASAATLLHAIGYAAAALALRLSRSSFTDFVWKNATKKDKSHYSRNVPKDVHTINDNVTKSIQSVTFQAVIALLLLTLLAVMLRRTRGATVARWTIVLFSVLLRSPFNILGVAGDLPIGFKIAQVFVGVASLAAILLLFLPSSSAYFREVRSITSAGKPAKGLGGLFAPRARPTTSLTKSAPKSAASTPAPKADEAPKSEKAAQHKQRTNAAAVAKGAELARNRAKAAAKSRRMED